MDNYNALVNFIKSNDMSKKETYEKEDQYHIDP